MVATRHGQQDGHTTAYNTQGDARPNRGTRRGEPRLLEAIDAPLRADERGNGALLPNFRHVTDSHVGTHILACGAQAASVSVCDRGAGSLRNTANKTSVC